MIEEMRGDFLQWLRGFYFVAQRRSFTLAGRAIGRNQPTVSHQIKRLEDEFGIKLLDRSQGRMDLTPEGKRFFEKTITIFEVIKEMREISEDYLLESCEVSIASTHAVIHCYLPEFVQQFRDKAPNVSIRLSGGTLRDILEHVELAEVDFGIASLYQVSNNTTYHELFETRLKLITPKKNVFHLGETPTLEQISKLPFIAQPQSATRTPLIERKFAERGLTNRKVLILNNFESIKKYVAYGVGVSIVDDFTLTEKDTETLDILSLDGIFQKESYGIIMRQKKHISPAAKALMAVLKPDIELTS